MKVSCYLIVQGQKPKHGLYRDTRRLPGDCLGYREYDTHKENQTTSE